MPCRPMIVWTVLATGLTLGLVEPSSPADPVRLSGTVAEVDPAQGVLVIDEIGPWRVVQGQTVVTRRTIEIRPSTRFSVFIRVDVPGRFAGDFLEVALEASDVAPGDFATAECVRERGRLVALSVTVADVVQP